MGVGWFIFAIALLLSFTTTVAIQLPRILAAITTSAKLIGGYVAEERNVNSPWSARAIRILRRSVSSRQEDVQSDPSTV
jgi:hypothetical protein